MTKTKEITILEKDYFDDLQRIKDTIRTNQAKAMVVVNSAMIMTYYEIGTIINQRKVWGSKYIENLANDLKEYGKGYSYEQLKRMSHLANEFSNEKIRSHPVTQIPWSTLITVILPKSKSHEEMLWYIEQTHKNRWSRSQVELQFKAKAYERYLINPDISIQDSEVSINTELNDLINKAENADLYNDYGLYMNLVDAIDSQAKKEATKHIISESQWNKLMRRYLL